MSQVKYSKLRNFKIVTGEHFLDLTQKISEGKGDVRLDAMETVTLALYLLDTESNVSDAKKEYQRLTKPENADEKYDILDAVDGVELANDVMGR